MALDENPIGTISLYEQSLAKCEKESETFHFRIHGGTNKSTVFQEGTPTKRVRAKSGIDRFDSTKEKGRELIRFRSICKKHSRILSIRGNVRRREGNREILLATRSITSENCRYTLQRWFSRSLPLPAPPFARTNVDIPVGEGDVAETVRSF